MTLIEKPCIRCEITFVKGKKEYCEKCLSELKYIRRIEKKYDKFFQDQYPKLKDKINKLEKTNDQLNLRIKELNKCILWLAEKHL